LVRFLGMSAGPDFEKADCDDNCFPR